MKHRPGSEGEREAMASVSFEGEGTMKASELAMCSVCAGAGKPVSGAECICGGSGLEADEILGLRGECFRLRDKLERFIALADELEDDSQSSLWTGSEQAIFAQIAERLNKIGRSS